MQGKEGEMDWINEPEEGVAPACGQLLLLRARGMHEEVPQSVLHVPFLGGRDELLSTAKGGE